MFKRHLKVALIFTIFLQISFCALLQYPKEVSKGEILSIKGPCEAKTITISARLYDYLIFSENIKCENNNFSFSKKITYDMPSGLWKISAGKYLFNINVKHSRESKFLAVKLLSPAKKVERTQKITIAAEVTDAGKKVSDANVYAFLPTGKKLTLLLAEKGIYSAEYEIPYNVQLKPWRLIIIATHPCEFCTEKISAGEEEFTIAIQKAKILLNILEPKTKTFPLEKKEIIVIKATYANNQPLKNPTAYMFADNRKFEFKMESDTIFKTSFTPLNSEGAREIKIIAYDDANNFAELKTNFIFIKDISWYIKHLLPLLIFYSALIFILFILLVSALKFLKKKLTIKQKISILEAQLKELQKKYYNGKISKTFYKEAAIKLEEEISKLKSKL